ncbi:hypothetical protein SAY87_018404 [Trapa incisa]|uniref:Pentatricopeptide repeat-containing protein n=1 Tax=Trapa incisa TaxID=236973 RepID=A0AAN7QTR4_9MYRT|nr:hypothetical protein SAY87_018404 [Trapa incisa]
MKASLKRASLLSVTVPCAPWHQSKPSRCHTTDQFAELLRSCNDISVDRARRLFDEMPDPNVVSWTSLMAGYSDQGLPGRALHLYVEMRRGPVAPNEFTLGTAVNACAALTQLEMGRRIHAHVVVLDLRDNLVVYTSLVDMYGKCSRIDDARRAFDLMGCRKNVVSWTSMISAYTQNAQASEALGLFKEYCSNSAQYSPNQFMLASVISACTSLGRLSYGKAAHCATIRLGSDSNEVIGSAIVDMYAKCGCLAYSSRVFQSIENPSVIVCTSMIVGAAEYGLGKSALELLAEMARRNLQPNDVTFVGILHACSHSGLVDKGLECLDLMHQKYGIQPDSRHYTCVVDMLCRAGRIDQAYQLAKSMKIVRPEEGALLWGTVLSASKLLGRLDIAREASCWLVRTHHQVAGAYVAMSNTYVSLGDWTNSENIRTKMKSEGVKKDPGCSWVEIGDRTHEFYAGNLNFPRREEAVGLLMEMESRMRERVC